MQNVEDDVVDFVTLRFGLGVPYRCRDRDRWGKLLRGGIYIRLIFGSRRGMKRYCNGRGWNNILERHGLAVCMRDHRFSHFNMLRKGIIMVGLGERLIYIWVHRYR